jgi:hypothetical protein
MSGVGNAHVGTAALGCPVEQSSTVFFTTTNKLPSRRLFPFRPTNNSPKPAIPCKTVQSLNFGARERHAPVELCAEVRSSAHNWVIERNLFATVCQRRTNMSRGQPGKLCSRRSPRSRAKPSTVETTSEAEDFPGYWQGYLTVRLRRYMNFGTPDLLHR